MSAPVDNCAQPLNIQKGRQMTNSKDKEMLDRLEKAARSGAQLSGILGVSQSARQTFPVLEVKNRVAKLDFWRPAVPFIRTAFHRVLDPLDRRVVNRVANRVVSEHKGNHGVGEGDGAWTCQRHLKALLFAQLAGLSSLREIEQALAARPEALYHLGLRVAGKSTLSDANAARRRSSAIWPAT